MEITVLSEEENPMLHRRDVRFRVSHVEETPDRLAVRDSLAARLNKTAEEVVVRRLDTKFGMRETIGEAKVYETAEHAGDVEQEYMLDRNKVGAEDGAAEAEPEDAEAAEDTEEELQEVEEPADQTQDAEPAETEAEPEGAEAETEDVEETEDAQAETEGDEEAEEAD